MLTQEAQALRSPEPHGSQRTAAPTVFARGPALPGPAHPPRIQ